LLAVKNILLTIQVACYGLCSAQSYKPLATFKVLPVEFAFRSSRLEQGVQFGLKNALWESSRDQLLNNKHRQFYDALYVQLGLQLTGGNSPYNYSSFNPFLAFSYQKKGTKGFYVEPIISGAYKRKLYHKREVLDQNSITLETSCSMSYDRSTFRESNWAYFLNVGYLLELAKGSFDHAPKFSLGIGYRFHQLKVKRARKYCS
jgi:hypothetical protein